MTTAKKIYDGGPAFPQPNHIVEHEAHGRVEARNWMKDSGMSLRAYFAGKALPSLIMLVTSEDIKKFTPEQIHKHCVRGAVMIADALIAELEKSE